MDYSLLVGIHDCTIPVDVVDESTDNSSDEDCSDQPLSPSNTGEILALLLL